MSLTHVPLAADSVVSLLVSIAFVTLQLSFKPHRRSADGILSLLVQLSLILVYICVLLIKTCNASTTVCTSFGFGDTADGEGGF